jgi:hypothetical protein
MRMNDSKIPGTRFILPLFVAALFFLPGLAMAQEYRLETAVPAWAVKIEPDMTSPVPEEDIASGLYFLLNEKQISYVPPGREQYFHQAYLIANSSGLENAGTLTIDFDPSYQNLKVNFIRVRRDKKVIDQTTQARISVLQREQNLEFRIYDGAKTFTAILGDLRVGDVVEYGYTLSGANPVFGGAAFDVWELQDMAGVRRAYYRVLVPADKTLATKTFVRSISPGISKTGSTAEYVWDDSALPALLPDENLPMWWFSFPAVQVSEYQSWGDVSAWAWSVYQPLFSPDEAVATLARKLSVGLESPEARVTAFIAFVQNEIRYLGIEVGMNSHKPNPPALVIERRFGDCKDKSLLLTALCRAQGVEAWPVLVNSFMGSHLGDFLPSPNAFNHVITLIRLGGRDYWIDATMTQQASALSAISPSKCNFGLILREGKGGLTANPSPRFKEPLVTIKETINTASGFTLPGTLDVETVYRSISADNQRRYFAVTNPQKIQKDFMEYYVAYFKDLEMSGKISKIDDPIQNKFTTRETYRLPSPWTRNAEGKYFQFSLYPHDLQAFLTAPNSGKRLAPYAIYYPAHELVVMEVLLPQRVWNIKNDHFKIQNRYFSLNAEYVYTENRLTCSYEYESFQDYVPAGELSFYLKDLAEANEKLNIVVTEDYEDADRSIEDSIASQREKNRTQHENTSQQNQVEWDQFLNIVVIFLIIFVSPIPVFIILARRRSRKNSKPFISCRVCGRTSELNPTLVFTKCSTCDPARFFCVDHYPDHKHLFS